MSRGNHSSSARKAATLITGASTGLGKEFAKQLARDGEHLILVARRKDKLDELASELTRSHSVDVWSLGVDLAEPGAVSKLVAAVGELPVHVQNLINNAGVGHLGLFAKGDLSAQLASIQLNVLALVELTGLLLPQMLERKSGSILNIGSTAGFQPGPGMATYYATKAFVNSWSEALHHELRGTGVSVTLSCPGPTITEFAHRAGFADKNPLFDKMAATADEVVAEAISASRAGERRVVHGLKNQLMAGISGMVPNGLVLPLVSRLHSRTD